MITVDVAQETGEWRRFVWVVGEIINADVGKLPDNTVKGRHLIMHFIYLLLACGGSTMVPDKGSRIGKTRCDAACERF